jgi:hypothetical protein
MPTVRKEIQHKFLFQVAEPKTEKITKKTKAWKTAIPEQKPVWKNYERISFRIAFIFFIIYSVPWDPGFYGLLYHIDYAHLNYRHLTEIVAFFNPQFINIYSESGFFGLASYVNFPFVLLLSVTGAAIWGALDKTRTEYNVLYYWVRVFARYRVAYGVIAWGYKKIFIMQMPFPNVGLEHTEFIDFFAKRLYWESIGIAPRYEVFLGFAEFIPGFLLLFRRTTTLGAALSFVVLGNVALANHAYDIGEQVPAACLSLLSLFILWHDLPAIINLIVYQKDAKRVPYYPTFSSSQNFLRHVVKWSGNGIFVGFFCISEVYGFTHNDFYKIPNTTGLEGTKGYYTVTEFKLNNEVLPYAPTDTLRWQDASFEDWSSMSFKVVNRPDNVEMFAAGSYPRRGEPYTGAWSINFGDVRRFESGTKKGKPEKKYDPSQRDINTTWELSGISSERKWYYYKEDKINHILYLQNKNRSNRDQKQVLHYERPTATRIILWGTNEFDQHIHVILDKVSEDLPLLQDGRKPIPDWLNLKEKS